MEREESRALKEENEVLMRNEKRRIEKETIGDKENKIDIENDNEYLLGLLLEKEDLSNRNQALEEEVRKLSLSGNKPKKEEDPQDECKKKCQRAEKKRSRR